MGLGWSRQELRTWLGCTPHELDQWMKSQVVPKDLYASRVSPLIHHLEAHSEFIRLAPLADKILEEKKYNQLNLKTAA